MIDRDQMFEPMLEAHPAFASLWGSFVDEWSNDPEGLPHYILISDLVSECCRMLNDGEHEHIRRILAVVERWHTDGDENVQEAATVGFLEGLQNRNLHTGTEPTEFIQFLGPESSYWWTKVERFWTLGELLIDDR